MPLTQLLLRTKRIEKITVRNIPNVPKPQPTFNSDQRLHAFTNARATHEITSTGDAIDLAIIPNVNGDVIYIPWGMGEIHSVEIPQNQLAHINLFVTAQMQGCQLVVDKMGDGSYRFHHGNSLQIPSEEQSATQPTFQTPGALNDLSRLHDITRPGNNAPQIAVTGKLSKAQYFAGVERRLAKKRANGRTGITYDDPECVSFAYIVGFRAGNGWSIWYQTSSQFIYTRPSKAVFRKKEVEPLPGHDLELIEAREAFRI